MTAHTLNDQAETFLMNLIRGSGLDGLGGMKPARIQNSKFKTQNSNEEIEIHCGEIDCAEIDNESKIQNPKSKILLIRPLLRWAKREDTENFCLLNQIEFRYDSMNEDLAFRRVRIRKVLLPLLKDFNPRIVETLGKTAELLRENAEALAQFVNSHAAHSEIVNESENFSSKTKAGEDEAIEVLVVKDLKNVFPSMRRFIVREWLKNRRGDLRRISAKHFEAIESLTLSRKSGNIIELPGDEVVIKKDGKLFYEKRTVEKS